MKEVKIRVGDVVAVTARVVGIRGDGGYSIEPLGFDYEAYGEQSEDQDLPIDFYTVDEPRLVQHIWVRGDEMFVHADMITNVTNRLACGQRLLYHKDLGEGLHLMNLPDVEQRFTGAWIVMATGEVAELRPDPPEIIGRG